MKCYFCCIFEIRQRILNRIIVLPTVLGLITSEFRKFLTADQYNTVSSLDYAKVKSSVHSKVSVIGL